MCLTLDVEMSSLDRLRMVVREGGNGCRRVEHDITVAEECVPLLLELQTCRVGREPLAMAHDRAARALGSQAVIAR